MCRPICSASTQSIAAARAGGRTLLTEVEAKELLAAAGIPVAPAILAATVEQAVARPRARSATRWCSNFTRKRSRTRGDVGGVQLNLTNDGPRRWSWACWPTPARLSIHAFAAQHGADVTATVTGASPAQLSATTRPPGVTASAGPFPEATLSVHTPASHPLHPCLFPAAMPRATPTASTSSSPSSGRASPGGPVDDLTLTAGHWAQGPGQIVLSSQSGPATRNRVAGHGDWRAGLADADRGRHRDLGHRHRAGLGHTRRDSPRCTRRGRRKPRRCCNRFSSPPQRPPR